MDNAHKRMLRVRRADSLIMADVMIDNVTQTTSEAAANSL